MRSQTGQTNRRLNVFALLIITMAVIGSGCSVGQKRSDLVESDQARVVARDFVSALTQLRGYSPRNTTLQLRPVVTSFGEALAGELRTAGYGMQMVLTDDSGPFLVSYEADGFENTTGRSVGYRIRVGAVEMGREYEIRNGRVFPMTALSVIGTTISSEPLDQSIFDRNLALEAEADVAGDRVFARGAPTVDSAREAPRREQSPPLLEPLGDVVNEPDEWRATREPPSSGGTHQRLPSRVGGTAGASSTATRLTPATASVATDNTTGPEPSSDLIRESDHGPYLSTRQQTVVRRIVLNLDKEASSISDSERTALQQFAQGFDASRQRVILLHCSPDHPPPAGNLLAVPGTGADEVRGALLAAGIPANRLIHERCLAHETASTLSDHALVVSLHEDVNS